MEKIPFSFEVENISQFSEDKWIDIHETWEIAVKKYIRDSKRYFGVFLYCKKMTNPPYAGSFNVKFHKNNCDLASACMCNVVGRGNPCLFTDGCGWGGEMILWNDLMEAANNLVTENDSIKLTGTIFSNNPYDNVCELQCVPISEDDRSIKFDIHIENIDRLMAEKHEFQLKDILFELTVYKSKFGQLGIRIKSVGDEIEFRYRMSMSSYLYSKNAPLYIRIEDELCTWRGMEREFSVTWDSLIDRKCGYIQDDNKIRMDLTVEFINKFNAKHFKKVNFFVKNRSKKQVDNISEDEDEENRSDDDAGSDWNSQENNRALRQKNKLRKSSVSNYNIILLTKYLI